VDVVRFGRGIRALRQRIGWRQDDLAREARVSRSAVGRIERGRADRVTVAALDRVAAALDARVIVRLDWRAEQLDRLLDAAHSGTVDLVVAFLTGAGWLVATEVSFSIYGERGSIDVLAFHPTTRTLLVVEVKSTVPDVGPMLMTLDRKVRLAPGIARQRGWEVGSVARLLVIRDGATARRRVAALAATFANAFPVQGAAVKRWLRCPDRPISGLWFLSPAPGTATTTRSRVRRSRGGGDSTPAGRVTAG
jgi:transcriptional regulator with XRE-family HTH domain